MTQASYSGVDVHCTYMAVIAVQLELFAATSSLDILVQVSQWLVHCTIGLIAHASLLAQSNTYKYIADPVLGYSLQIHIRFSA